MSSNSDGSWPRNMPEAFRRRGNDETWVRACRSNHGDHAHRDVRYGLADGGKHVEEGLTFRAEGQPGLWGWDNVRLVAAPADRAPIDGTADAALFCAVHDVMQSRAALEHVFDHLRPGAPVAAAGGKWPSAWLWSLRACLADLHVPFVTDFSDFDRPWRLLAELAPDLRVHELAFGAGYLALGRAPDR